MFVRTSNGYLLNLDKVKTIYVCVEKDNMCNVKSKVNRRHRNSIIQR